MPAVLVIPSGGSRCHLDLPAGGFALWLRRQAGAAAGPATEGIDLIGHQLAQGHGFVDPQHDAQIRRFFPPAESVIQSVDERLLDLRAGPALGRSRQLVSVVVLGVASELADLNPPDRFTLLQGW